MMSLGIKTLMRRRFFDARALWWHAN